MSRTRDGTEAAIEEIPDESKTTSNRARDDRRQARAAERITDVVPFQFNACEVRTIYRAGQVWFVADDVCRVLELTNSRTTIGRLESDERDSVQVQTGSVCRRMGVINESGLFALVLTSNKPEAKTFRRWITSEVIPTIRRTGSFHIDGAGGAAKSDDVLAAGKKPGIYIVIVEQDRRTVVETNGKELYAITDNGLGGIMAGCLVTVQNALEIIASGDCKDGDTSAAKDWLKSAVEVGAEVAGRFIKLQKRQPLDELPPPMARQH